MKRFKVSKPIDLDRLYEALKEIIGNWSEAYTDEEVLEWCSEWDRWSFRTETEKVQVERGEDAIYITGLFTPWSHVVREDWTFTPEGYEGYREEIDLNTGERKFLDELPDYAREALERLEAAQSPA